MLTKKSAILAVLCTLAVAGTGATSASASSYLHGGGVTTAKLLATGTNISGTIQPGAAAVFQTNLGTITCTTGSSSTTVGSSGGASISASQTAVSLGSCSSTWPSFHPDTCQQVGTPIPVTITATGSTGGTVGSTNPLFFCHYPGSGTPGFGCYFKGSSANGAWSNSASGGKIAYSNVGLINYQPSGTPPAGGGTSLGTACGSTQTFSVTFGAISATNGAFTGPVALNTTA
jgi:hypothetical protein